MGGSKFSLQSVMVFVMSAQNLIKEKFKDGSLKISKIETKKGLGSEITIYIPECIVEKWNEMLEVEGIK
jgi:hypothetical protein